VGRVVLSALRDPRSRSDPLFQTIQEWEVKKPIGGEGVCTKMLH
jgi:hypothetical protein